MSTNYQYFKNLDNALKESKKTLFRTKDVVTIRLSTFLKGDVGTFKWFGAYFKSEGKKDWLEKVCNIQMQGRGDQRELIISKKSSIAKNLNIYSILGDLNTIMVTKSAAHIAPAELNLAAPFVTPAANGIGAEIIGYDPVGNLVVPIIDPSAFIDTTIVVITPQLLVPPESVIINHPEGQEMDVRMDISSSSHRYDLCIYIFVNRLLLLTYSLLNIHDYFAYSFLDG